MEHKTGSKTSVKKGDAKAAPHRQPEAKPAQSGAAPADYILYLQRTIGNQAVGQVLAGGQQPPPDHEGRRLEKPGPRRGSRVWQWQGGAVQRLATLPGRSASLRRHTSNPQRYEENNIQTKRMPGPIVQRHTSVPLRYEEDSIQAKRVADGYIQRDLIDTMNDALDGWGGDVARIKTAITAASVTERTAALNDPRLVRRLQSELSRTDAMDVLNDLGAPLSQRLTMAMSGWGADGDAAVAMINNLPAARAAEKDAVLRNPQLMARLRGELSRQQAVDAMSGLGAPLAEQLYAAMDGWGADVALIVSICTDATDPQKLAAVRDRALIDRLRNEIADPTQMYEVLRLLGVSLSDRLNVAMDGWGVDSVAILEMARLATPEQRRQVLHDSATIARLRDELPRPSMLTVLERLEASLTDRLNVAMDGWGVDSAAILTMIPAAEEGQRLAAYADATLMARLQEELGNQFEQARLLLRFGSQEAIDAATEDERAATAAPENLTHLISTELNNAEPDTAKILTDIQAASAEDKELVRSNSELMRRLAAALSAEQMQQAQAALGEGLVNRLNTLIEQTAPVADFLTLIGAADADAKLLVLTNRALLDRIRGYFSEADAQSVLTALGDSLANRLDQARQNGATIDAILSLIEGADETQRRAAELEAGALNQLQATYGNINFWRIQLHLRFVNAAGYPTGAVTLLTTLNASPAYTDIRRTLVNMATPDFDVLKVAPGLRELLQTLVTSEEYVGLLRVLDQGLVTDEAVNWSWSETLQNDDPDEPGNIFEPMVYTGTGAFDVAYFRDRLQIDVRIKMNAGDTAATALLSSYKTRLEPQIEGIWDNKFNVRNANGTLPIRVNCNFTSGNPHHSINVYAQSTGVQYGMYNLSNWYPDASGFSNLAPSHEFGHMLGNRDEYNLSNADYQGTVDADPTTDGATQSTDDTGAVRFTNDSVMGSNVGGRVDPRHLNYFVNWINENRRKDADNNFIEPAFTLVP